MAHSSSSSKTSSSQNIKRKHSKEDDVHETMGSLLQDAKELNEKIDAQNRYVEKLEKDLRSAELSKKEMLIKVKELMKDAIQRIDSKSQCFPENEAVKNSVEGENEEIAKLLSENSALKNTVEKQNEEMKKNSLLLSENLTSKITIGELEEEIANLNGQLTDKECQLNKLVEDATRSILMDSDSKRSDELQNEIHYLKSQLKIANEVSENKRKENEFNLAVMNQEMQELTEKFKAEKSFLQIESANKIRILEFKLVAAKSEMANDAINVKSEKC